MHLKYYLFLHSLLIPDTCFNYKFIFYINIFLLIRTFPKGLEGKENTNNSLQLLSLSRNWNCINKMNLESVMGSKPSCQFEAARQIERGLSLLKLRPLTWEMGTMLFLLRTILGINRGKDIRHQVHSTYYCHCHHCYYNIIWYGLKNK